MDNNFFAYLQQLELMAYFSGYPLFYAVILFIVGAKRVKNSFTNRMVVILPYSYALVGSLFLASQLRNLYPDYSIENIKQSIQLPWLMAWGLLSVFFWIPAIAKKTIFSLLHSLVFFFFLARDLFLQLWHSSPDKNIIKNDMKIYTDSLLLNLVAFVFLMLVSFLFTKYRRRSRP